MKNIDRLEEAYIEDCIRRGVDYIPSDSPDDDRVHDEGQLGSIGGHLFDEANWVPDVYIL